MRRFLKAMLAVVILATMVTLGVDVSYYMLSRQARMEKLQQERDHLQRVINRLTGKTRRAELVVDGQVLNGRGQVLQTTLLWREFTIGRGGKEVALPMRKITIAGDMPHVDGIVLKFQNKYVEDGDLLRGKSLVFFRSIYGNSQAPDQGVSLLGRGGVPAVLLGPHNRRNIFAQSLWNKIWQLLKHPLLAKKEGLDVVQGEAVYRPVKRGRLYVIYLRNDGGPEFTVAPGESSLVDELLNQASQAHSRVSGSP